MPKAVPIQNAFNAGEWSWPMYGRTDLPKYYNAVRRMRNIIPKVQGPAVRRGGTMYVTSVKTASEKTHLVPFEFGTTQAYAIEAGNAYFRFFRNNGQIVTADITASISNGTFDSNITGWTDQSTGSASIAHNATNSSMNLVGAGSSVAWAEQQVTNSSALAHTLRFRVRADASTNRSVFLRIGTSSTGSQIVNDVEFAVGYHTYTFTSTAADFYLQFRNTAAFTTEIDDVELTDNAAVEVTTEYATADVGDVKWAQSADTLYLVHPSYPPFKLTRTAHTSWSVTEINFQDGPYLPTNLTDTTLTPSGGSYATGDTPTVTASSIVGINDNTGFQTTDIGRLLRIKNGSNWAWGRIATRSSTTVVTVTVIGTNSFPSSGVADWRLGSWSDTTGYPRAVTFFQDRLCFGGEPAQRIDMSQSGDYENFAPDDGAGTVADDDAIGITLNANNVNVIRWLTDDEKALVCGTVGGEWLVRASTLGETVTPDNVQATRSTTFGSADLQPLRIDVATLFVQRAGFKVHEHAYVFEADGFRSPNLTLHASEITRSASGGVTRLAYQQEPDSIVWAVRADGQLIGLSYEREQDVVGFHRHSLGGFSDSGQSVAPVVESIAVIPASDGSRDELWLTVQRYINGAMVRSVEYMKPPLGENDDQEDAFYVDAGLTYDGSAVTTITGATHLIGQTVRLLVDGASHPDKVVDSGGEVALERAGSVVQLGLAYTSTLETMNLEAGAADGTAQTRTKRINEVHMRLHRTLGGKAGDNETSLDDIPDTNFRSPSTPMDTPPPLFSGDAKISWPGGYEQDGRVVWQSSDPFPAIIQAIVPHVVTNPR